jgi:AmpD protein
MRAALCWRMLRGHSVQVINLFMRFHISNGTITPAEQLVSPNFGDRPKGVPIDLVVVHSISLPPGEYGTGAVQRFFCNQLQVSEHPYFEEIAGLEVSAHVLIERSGKVTQFVNLDRRAWHAGRSCYEGREECNDFSIGIELEGTDYDVFEAAQYTALAALVIALESYYEGVTTERIVGHSDIAPGRKTDPGEGFDWQKLGCEIVRLREFS